MELCDHPSFVQIGILVGELWHFQHFPTWRPSAILNWNFVILDHPRSQPCGPITVSKFCVDPIFPAADIAILSFCQFGWKMSNRAPFLGVFGGLNPLKLWVVIKTPKKAHPWERTLHLSHKRLKSVQGCDLGASPRKKV